MVEGLLERLRISTLVSRSFGGLLGYVPLAALSSEVITALGVVLLLLAAIHMAAWWRCPVERRVHYLNQFGFFLFLTLFIPIYPGGGHVRKTLLWEVYNFLFIPGFYQDDHTRLHTVDYLVFGAIVLHHLVCVALAKMTTRVLFRRTKVSDGSNGD